MTRRSLAFFLLAAPAARAQKKANLKAANLKAEGLVGKPAPDFSLPDLSGQTFHLSDRRGNIVILPFWATWCPPCRSEMPGFARLQKELAPEGVDVVPVAFDDPEKARDFLTHKKLDVMSVVDKGGAVSRLYGANFLPRTVVIDREGIVAKVFLRKTSEGDLREAVQAARR
jgi:peroxiredoxin